MKRVKNLVGGALCVAALFATIGCDHIRDYSVNSYQGVLPAGEFRPSGSTTPSTITAETPKPSVPAQPPEAAPSAGAEATTKPAGPTK